MNPLDLTATDGLTNSNIRFARLDVLTNGSARLWFEFTNEDRSHAGEISVLVGPTTEGTADSMIAAGHAQVANMLRQWLYVTSKHYEAYARRSPT